MISCIGHSGKGKTIERDHRSVVTSVGEAFSAIKDKKIWRHDGNVLELGRGGIYTVICMYKHQNAKKGWIVLHVYHTSKTMTATKNLSWFPFAQGIKIKPKLQNPLSFLIICTIHCLSTLAELFCHQARPGFSSLSLSWNSHFWNIYLLE